MAHVYDDNGFRHFLKFYDFGMDWYEISEPIGFDGAKYVKRRLESAMFARDVEYFAIEGLEFPDAFGQKMTTSRTYNPQGDLSEFMDYGFHFIMENRRLKGSEMKIGYKISRNDLDFREFEFSNEGVDTDGQTYYKCKLVDIGIVSDHFRNLKNTFNAFSDKNWKNETITPMPSVNFLYKSPEINTVSIFVGSNRAATTRAFSRIANGIGFFPPPPTIFKTTSAANPAMQLEQSEINNTLSFISISYASQDAVDSNGIMRKIPNDTGSFQHIDFINDSFNVKFKFTDIQAKFRALKIDSDERIDSASGYGNLLVVIGNNLESEPFDAYELHRINFGNETTPIYDFPTSLELTIPFIQRGKRAYVYYSCDNEVEYNDNPAVFDGSYTITGVINNHRLEISLLEKPLNYVIKASRYINLIKQAGMFTNELPTIALDFDVNGEHYDQFVFNKSVVLRDNPSLFTTPEDVYKSTMEVCAEVEISKDNIQVLKYPDLYANVEIGAFPIIPSDEYSEPNDEELMLNNFGYKFKNYEQEKTVKNTSKAIHTDSSWRPENLQAKNKKEIEVAFVRDPFETNEMISLALNEKNTTTEKDSKIFIQTAVRLAPNTVNIIRDRLLMQWVEGKLEILNRDDAGDSSNQTLIWTGLGFEVGASVSIIEGSNIGNYTVSELNKTVLILQPIGSVSQFNGVAFIAIRYFYTNVLWQTETNEAFSIAPAGFANLKRSIKRNLLDQRGWLLYLSAVLQKSKGNLANAEFKNNGTLQTQLLTESAPITENATIDYSTMLRPLVDGFIVKSKIVANYDDVVAYLDAYRQTKGFIRLFNPNGKVIRVYPYLFEYLIATNEVDIEAEKKYEDEFLRIDIIGQEVFVNDAPYDLSGAANWFITKNDFIQLYDKKSQPLSNYYRYDFVILNGIKYNSINELVTQLNTIVWT